MAKIEVKKIVNANVYMDGTNLLGRASEFQAPNVKLKMSDHEALGLVGVPEFPSGIEKIESKIKWASLYPDVLAKVANPFKAYSLQVRGNLETYTSQGRVDEVPIVGFVTATFKNLPMGDYKPRANAEFETDLAVLYCKLTVEGRDILEVDLLANIWRGDGEDLLANFRTNIGA